MNATAVLRRRYGPKALPGLPQWARLLKALKELDSLHTFDIREELRIGNPSERITDLENRGWAITHAREKRGDSWGTRYTLTGRMWGGDRGRTRPVAPTSPPRTGVPTLEVWNYCDNGRPRTYRREATPAEIEAFFPEYLEQEQPGAEVAA